MAKRKSRRSFGRRVAVRRSTRKQAGVGGILMKGAMGAVGLAAASVAAAYVPISQLSAGIKAALILGLAYLFGLRHPIVTYGAVLAVGMVALSYISPMLSSIAGGSASTAGIVLNG
jgi:hypothetical protein